MRGGFWSPPAGAFDAAPPFDEVDAATGLTDRAHQDLGFDAICDTLARDQANTPDEGVAETGAAEAAATDTVSSDGTLLDAAPMDHGTPDQATADRPAPDTSGGDAWTADCTAAIEYTPCTTITVPDRDYDICQGGACTSPGCGTRDCNPLGPGFALPDTGQRLCYDGAAAIACPGNVALGTCGSTPFCGQDAQYGWDLGHQANERYLLTELVAGEPVVVDNITGLMWQGCSSGLRGSACTDGTMASHTWTESIDQCETLAWGGHTDWHLPDRFELSTTVHFERYAPALDSAFFAGAVASTYWSISADPEDATRAYYVGGTTGIISVAATTTASGVRCVRRHTATYPLPAGERFVRQGLTQPVVVDNAMGLMWQGCLAGQDGTDCSSGSASSVSWQAALSYCADLDWGSFADWRLPSVLEGQSVLWDRTTITIHLDPSVFPNPVTNPVWCSTTNAQFLDEAWYLNRSAGAVNRDLKSRTKSVMCVRDAP
ncbi:MAG: DUF1566 domain-containing protein [Pseudomonadota bacterium]